MTTNIETMPSLQRGSRLPLKAAFGIAVSTALVILVFQQVNRDELVRAFRALDGWTLAIAGVFIGINLLFACLRYWSILLSFHQRTSFATAARATLFGAIGGFIFFQVIGQTLSRWAVLRRANISSANVVVTSLYERLMALIILLFGAVVSAVLLYGKLDVALGRNSLFLVKSLVLVAFSVFVIGVIVLRREMALLWQTIARSYNVGALLRDIALTVCVQGAMLGAYLALIYTLSTKTPVGELAGASIIIMFVASFPVSFAGWGVRELGAVFAFGYLGIAEPSALAVSVAIGVLSMIGMIVGAIAAAILEKTNRKARTATAAVDAQGPVDFSRFLFMALPICCAGLVMFHAWIPGRHGFVNVNLADPVAIAGGLLFVLYLRRIDLSGAYQLLIPVVVGASLLVATSLLIGYLRFGPIDWALINRGVGWLVILGYLAVGGLAALVSPRIAAFRVGRILMWVAVVVVAGDLLLVSARVLGVREFVEITPLGQFVGESINPNAFAFQLLLVLAAMLGLIARKHSSRRAGVYAVALGLIFAGLYFAQSRTGYVTFAVLLLSAWAIGFWHTKRLLQGTAIAFCVVVAYALLPHIIGVLPHIIALLPYGKALLPYIPIGGPDPLQMQGLLRPMSEMERLASILGGLQIFGEYPFFGGGLGAFVNAWAASHQGYQLVIHSTPVWILAEFGLFGGLFFGAVFVSLFRHFYTRYQEYKGFESGLGLLTLIVFVVFGLPHDIFYQRLFWFLLGMCAMNGGRMALIRRRTCTAMMDFVVPAKDRCALGEAMDAMCDKTTEQGANRFAGSRGSV